MDIFAITIIFIVFIGSSRFARHAIDSAWTDERFFKELRTAGVCAFSVGFMDIFVSGGFLGGLLFLMVNYLQFMVLSILRWKLHHV